MNENVEKIINQIESETGIDFVRESISDDQYITNKNGERLIYNIIPVFNGNYAVSILRCGCDDCNNILQFDVLYHEKKMKKDAGIIASIIRDSIDGDILVLTSKC